MKYYFCWIFAWTEAAYVAVLVSWFDVHQMWYTGCAYDGTTVPQYNGTLSIRRTGYERTYERTAGHVLCVHHYIYMILARVSYGELNPCHISTVWIHRWSEFRYRSDLKFKIILISSDSRVLWEKSLYTCMLRKIFAIVWQAIVS